MANEGQNLNGKQTRYYRTWKPPPPHDKHQMEKEAQRVILIRGKNEGPALPQGGSLMIT